MHHALLHLIHINCCCRMSGCEDCLKPASKARQECCMAIHCSSIMSLPVPVDLITLDRGLQCMLHPLPGQDNLESNLHEQFPPPPQSRGNEHAGLVCEQI